MEGFTLSTPVFSFFPAKSTSSPRLNFFISASKYDYSDEFETTISPKLTLPKVVRRNANPNIETEDYRKKKHNLDDDIILRKPVPKKGIKFPSIPTTEPKKNVVSKRPPVIRKVVLPEEMLRRPGAAFPEKDIKAYVPPSESSRLTIKSNLVLKMSKGQKETFTDITLLKKPQAVVKEIDSDEMVIPEGMLRKPGSAFPEKDIKPYETPYESSRVTIKSKLDAKSKDQKGSFNDIELLKKPQVVSVETDSDENEKISRESVRENSVSVSSSSDVFSTRLDANVINRPVHPNNGSFPQVSSVEDECKIEATQQQKPERLDQGSDERDQNDKISRDSVGENSISVSSIFDLSSTGLDDNDINRPIQSSNGSFSQLPNGGDESKIDATLQGRPQKLDQPSGERNQLSVVDTARMTSESDIHHVKNEESTVPVPLRECEDADWTKVEYLRDTEGREEIELISCSSRGFVGSFGSLVGFLPYRNLGSKWRFLAFESWLRKKGLDPSKYKQNLGMSEVYGYQNNTLPLDSTPVPEKIEGELSPDMKLEDLLELYDQDKTKFLSSFVGQKIKVSVVLADRKSRSLMFSGKPKESEESIEKKRSLMAKLNVGDVVKCCITQVTYFGVFVEVEGVRALIHESEVSWDATLNPLSFLKVGQVVEAKVHQLDFRLERIQLSLKGIMPDPLTEALESVLGDHSSLDGSVEAAPIDWDDVESLIKQLQQIEGIQSVSKGRFFLSPGLAPTFQVYMASMLGNRYKLLARSGKKVQEVIVQTSLDKEEMKATILTCINMVE